MKVNVKLYNVVTEQQPLEVQNIDGRVVEIYRMDDFEKVKNEFIRQGRFAVWSSVDGSNYRIFIESGYYEEFKELYSESINRIWVEFWDACEKISRTSTFKITIPVTGVALAACLLSSILLKGKEIGSYLSIGSVIVAFIVMMVSNSTAKRKIQQENVKSVDLIKKHLGEKRFEQLIEARKDYTDRYFAALYPEDEIEEEVSEEVETIETPEAEVVETVEAETVEAEVVEEVQE
jgi:hypothetical protein